VLTEFPELSFEKCPAQALAPPMMHEGWDRDRSRNSQDLFDSDFDPIPIATPTFYSERSRNNKKTVGYETKTCEVIGAQRS